MKRGIGILLFGFAIGASCQAGDGFMLGFNQSYRSEASQEIYTHPEIWRERLQQYDLNFVRFPGGTITYRYLWNADNLIGPSFQLDEEHELTDRQRQKREKLQAKAKREYPEESFRTFLEFCRETGQIPVIQLSTVQIVRDGEVLQLVQKGNQGRNRIDEQTWKLAEKDLADEVATVYQTLDRAIWEIGNEQYHLYPGKLYGQLVVRYLDAFTALGVADRVAVSFAGYTRDSGKSYQQKFQWNADLIRELTNQDALDRIGYFCPHFYFQSKTPITDVHGLAQRIGELRIGDFLDAWHSQFPKGYEPSFFLTEFASYKAGDRDPFFNTRAHALLHAVGLLQFMGDPRVAGVLLQGMNRVSNGYILSGANGKSGDADRQGMDEPYVSPVLQVTRLLAQAGPEGFRDLHWEGPVLVARGSRGDVLVNTSSVPASTGSWEKSPHVGSMKVHPVLEMNSFYSRDPLPPVRIGSSSLPPFSLTVLPASNPMDRDPRDE